MSLAEMFRNEVRANYARKTALRMKELVVAMKPETVEDYKLLVDKILAELDEEAKNLDAANSSPYRNG